jgi:hypothetical protein
VTKAVAILGCGPAGLMVAHAANQSGWALTIYSRRIKSQLFGAQYLHKPIPHLDTHGPQMVQYKLIGTPQEYRRKVYGVNWNGTVSPEDFMEQHYAWDLRRAYDWLWKQYEAWIVDADIPEYPVPYERFDLVISTVPRKIWANEGDIFESTKIWALGDGDYKRVHLHRPDDFHVVCDGSNLNPWYRVSNIFGHCTMEWPFYESDHRPARGASMVEKPLRHNSRSAPDFIHLGRYGAWEKGILTSDVFYQAMKVFADDKIK